MKGTPRELANEIRQWLLDHDMWSDVAIYFDGKCYSTMRHVGEGKYDYEFAYNDSTRLFEYDDDPSHYFEYVNPNHILSMSFEGPLYHVLNGYCDDWVELEAEFRAIFTKYGVYYELGNAWNLTCWEEATNES